MILTSRRRSLIFLHTIEICFNCFGARSFDTKNIKRRQKTPRNSNFTLIIDTPSPFLHASPRWREGLKEISGFHVNSLPLFPWHIFDLLILLILNLHMCYNAISYFVYLCMAPHTLHSTNHNFFKSGPHIYLKCFFLLMNKDNIK